MGRSAKLANLRRLLSPRHVAFIGGQKLAATIGYCVDAGFTGEIWPVNPSYPEIGGRRCYKTLADLPAPPDATFIAVPRRADGRDGAPAFRHGGGRGGLLCRRLRRGGRRGDRAAEAARWPRPAIWRRWGPIATAC